MRISLIYFLLLVGLAPTSTFAQTATEVFMRLWSNHIDICGPLLEEPLAVLDERIAPTGFDQVLWYGTEDRTDVTVNYSSSDYEWIAVIEVRTSATEISFHCSMGYGTRDGTRPFEGLPGTLNSILEIIDQTPQLTASGGQIHGLTDQDAGQFIHDASIVISGAFPNHSNTMSRLTTYGSGIRVQVDAFLPLRP